MVWDSKGANSFYLSGTAVDARSGFVVSADQLANLTLKGDTSAGTQTLWIRAHDGTKWGAWDAFTLTTTNSNTAPVATINDLSLAAGASTSVASLVSYSDSDGDAAQKYMVWDSKGANSFYLSGTAVDARSGFVVSADQLANLTLKGDTSAGTQTLWIRAHDGTKWGAWDAFTLTTTNSNTAPVATINDLSLAAGASTSVASLVSYSDSDGDAAQKYMVWDSKGANSFYLSGTAIYARSGFVVSADQLANLTLKGDTSAGTQTLWIRAHDGTKWGAWDAFTLTTTNSNTAPTVTSTALTSITEDSAYSYTFAASDVDSGDTITYAATTLPSWLTFNAKTGVLSGTPDNAQVGNHSVVLTATDSGGAVDTQSFTITVSNVNDAPTVTSTALTSITEDSAYSYTFAASDVDSGDTITYAATTLPSWLTFNAKTGVLSGTPDNAQVGNHSVVLTATDSGGAVDTQSFTITVSNVNDAPVATINDLSLAAGASTSVASLVSYSDSDGDAAQKYMVWDSKGANSFYLSGTAVDARSGFVVSADQLANLTLKGDTSAGTQTLWIRAHDGTEWGAWDAFTLTTTNSNTAPVATINDLSLAAGASTSVASLVSYSDSDGDAAQKYMVWDSKGANSFYLSGTAVDARSGFVVSADQLANLTLKGDTSAGTQTLWIRAHDGTKWGGLGRLHPDDDQLEHCTGCYDK